jgi:Nucleotidyltransferase domain
MNQQQLIDAVTIEIGSDPDLAGLFLSGSFGTGTADAYSDVDFLALVPPDKQTGFADRWRQILERIAPIVFWNRLDRGVIILNAITEDWLRCDVAIHAPDDLDGRSRANLKPLLDPGNIYGNLPETLAPSSPAGRVDYLIKEFIRVLGMLPIAIGRKEYFICVMGTGLLRGFLSDLMIDAVNPPDRGGILHPSKLLPEADMAVLNALPTPAADRDELIAANFAIAREFFPRARALAKELDIEWPEAFEEATCRNLTQHFGDEFDVRW